MSTFLGEFEQMVLLSVLQLEEEAFAIAIRRHLERCAGRRVSRGALYRTLDRLEEKGYLRWKVAPPSPERGGHPKRCFEATPQALQALRASRQALFKLWEGLEARLGEP